MTIEIDNERYHKVEAISIVFGFLFPGLYLLGAFGHHIEYRFELLFCSFVCFVLWLLFAWKADKIPHTVDTFS